MQCTEQDSYKKEIKMEEKGFNILDINLAGRCEQLAEELNKDEYSSLFDYNLPENDEDYSKEDEDLQDCLDFIKDVTNSDTRQIFFDHENGDPNAPITGVTVLDGLGNILIDKDFDTPIPVDDEEEEDEYFSIA